MPDSDTPDVPSQVPESNRRRRGTKQHRSRRSSSQNRKPGWYYLLVISVLVLVGFGGGTTLWSQGLLMMIVGFWALWQPPQSTPSRKLDWLLLLLGIWSLTAFIPYGLLGSSEWRDAIEKAGLNLGWMATPQPWISFEAFLLLLTGIVVFYLIWTNEPEYEERRRLLWLYVIGVAIMGVIQSVASFNDMRSPYQGPGLGFSFFPNKNQTGLFFAMGGVAAFGLTVHMLRCRRWSALLSVACLLACFLGVIFSISRAAIVLFFLGCIVTYLMAFSLRGGFRLLRYVVPILIMGMTILMILGRQSLERFSFWTEGITQDLRADIYQDTLKMSTQLPVSGLGLGNFAGVFPQFHENTDVAMSVIHPESDWLWAMSELGYPGLILLVMAILVLLARLFPFGDPRSVPYRAPALGGVCIFLIHSMVDVPAHRFGTLLCAFLLYRLSVAPQAREPDPLLPRWSFRILGVVILIGGAAWFASDVFTLPWNTKIAREISSETLAQPFSTEARDQMQEAIEQAMSASPLDWTNYTMRARYRLTFERDAQGANQDFQIARLLEPNFSDVPFQEGVIWMPYSPRQAAIAWREALNRNSTIEPIGLYRSMLSIGGKQRQFARELSNLSIVDTNFRYHYLLDLRERNFDETIYYEMSQDPKLLRFTPVQRAGILKHWAEKADGKTLREHLESYPDLTPIPWYYEGLSWAASGDNAKAVEVVQPYLTIPRFPEFTQFSMAKTKELRQAFLLNHDDIVRGSILLERQLKDQNWDAARNTATILCQAETVPDYARFWKGELDRRAGFTNEAWKAWRPYMDTLAKKSIEKQQSEESSSSN